METERAIRLELLLAEPLIERGLVREVTVPFLVIKNIIVLVAGQRGLDVDQNSSAVAFLVPRIRYLPDRAMRPLVFWCVAFVVNRLAGGEAFVGDLLPRQIDTDPHVYERISLERY